jgi:hypothetical protein
MMEMINQSYQRTHGNRTAFILLFIISLDISFTIMLLSASLTIISDLLASYHIDTILLLMHRKMGLPPLLNYYYSICAKKTVMLCNSANYSSLVKPNVNLVPMRSARRKRSKTELKRIEKRLRLNGRFQFLTIVIFKVSYLVLTYDLLYFFLIPIAEAIICIPVINSVIEILRANVLSP